ncbi:MAG: hypothetical protein U0T78_03305 [Cloacibacterium normanense]
MIKNYVIGAGGVLENPTEVKGYTENPTIKTDKKRQGNLAFYRKKKKKKKKNKYFRFAWAADKRLFCRNLHRSR